MLPTRAIRCLSIALPNCEVPIPTGYRPKAWHQKVDEGVDLGRRPAVRRIGGKDAVKYEGCVIEIL
jgi:hypothetical protein